MLNDLTKNKITLAIENTKTWVRHMDMFLERQEKPKGVAEPVWNFIKAAAAAVGIMLPAGVTVYTILSGIADGLSYPNTVTHTLKVIGDALLTYLPIEMQSMYAGFLALGVLCAAGIAGVVAIGWVADWVVKKFQTWKNTMAIGAINGGVKAISEIIEEIEKDIDSLTMVKVNELCAVLELMCLHLDIDTSDNFTTDDRTDRFENETGLAFMFHTSIASFFFSLKNNEDIPVCSDVDFIGMEEYDFIRVLNEAGLKDPFVYEGTSPVLYRTIYERVYEECKGKG